LTKVLPRFATIDDREGEHPIEEAGTEWTDMPRYAIATARPNATTKLPNSIAYRFMSDTTFAGY